MAGTTFSQFTPISVFPDTIGNENKVLLATGGGTQWGVVPIIAGGTGQTTAQASLDALTSGHLNLTGVGARIRGDFSNNNVTNRTAFQTLTTSAATHVAFVPNGAVAGGSTASAIELEDNTSFSTGNGSVLRIENRQGSELRISSTVRGTGTHLPLAFYVNSVKSLQLTTVGSNTVAAFNTGTDTSAYSQIVLNSAVAGGSVQLSSYTNNSAPYGQLTAGSASMPMYYDFNTHVFRTKTGSHLLSINSSGAVGVGASVSYGTQYQVLMSNGSSASPVWTDAITALTGAGGGTGLVPLTLGGTGITASSTDDLITQLGVKTYVQNYVSNYATANIGAKTISTAAPSGGNDGDVWYRI